MVGTYIYHTCGIPIGTKEGALGLKLLDVNGLFRAACVAPCGASGGGSGCCCCCRDGLFVGLLFSTSMTP